MSLTKGQWPLLEHLVRQRPRHDDDPTCHHCRLRAATIGDEAAATFQPPLGPTIKVRARSGGTVRLCPHCSAVQLNGERTTLAEAGLVNRAQIRRHVKKGRLKIDV